MNPARGRTSAVVVALVLGSLPMGRAQGPPDVIRVPLSRVDHVAGVGIGLTFDAARVAKAMQATPVTLPDPLPPGALVGFNSADGVFVLMSRAATGDGAVLVVDANVNRDLRDDPAVPVPRRTTPRGGAIVRIKRTYPGPPPVDVWLPYRFEYTPRAARSGVEEPAFFVTAAYRMEGTLSFQGLEHVAELHDFNQLGKFDKSNLSRGSVLRVFPRGAPDEERTWLYGYELIALGDEFYEVRDGALDGSWIELKRNTLAHALIGRAVPEFRMTDTGNATFTLSDYRGRYLLLDFWPSWCGPCIAQFPNIKKTVERYAEKLAVVGVNLDTESALGAARKIVADKGLTWRHVMEGRGYFLPIYQILGRLPERRMAFPLYVAIAPDGIIRYASNDFGKMQMFLDDALAPEPSRRQAMFVPMSPAARPRAASPLPVDFSSSALQALRTRPEVKLPPNLPEDARVGRLPNDVLVVARPGANPGRALLRVDANRDFDLTTDEEKEVPILDDTPSKLEDAPEFAFTVTYASGGAAFRPFRFYGRRPAAPGGLPEILYVGWEGRSSGRFAIGDAEYELSIADPTADLWWTADDLKPEGSLTLREKRGGKWAVVGGTSTRIPLAGRLFRVAHVHDDGQMLKLEPIAFP